MTKRAKRENENKMSVYDWLFVMIACIIPHLSIHFRLPFSLSFAMLLRIATILIFAMSRGC